MIPKKATQKQIDYAGALGDQIADLLGNSPRAKQAARKVRGYVAQLGMVDASSYITTLIAKRDYLQSQKKLQLGEALLKKNTLSSAWLDDTAKVVLHTSAPKTMQTVQVGGVTLSTSAITGANVTNLADSWAAVSAQATSYVALSGAQVKQQNAQINTFPQGYYMVAASKTGDTSEGYTDVVCVTKDKYGHAMAKRLWIAPYGKKHAKWVRRWNVLKMLALGGVSFTQLTQEQAASLGHLHGICVICGKQLTDPGSVEKGIGPVCLKNQGWV